AIQASASRREHKPARAITLAMRWPSRTSGAGVVSSLILRLSSVRATLALPEASACPKPEAVNAPNEKRSRPTSSRRGQGPLSNAEDAINDPMSLAFAEARAAEARGE